MGDIFKHGASAAIAKFCEGVQVGTEEYIPHCEYQFNSHSSPWFSAVCAAVIACINYFFHFLLVIVSKVFLKLPNFLMLIK